MECKQLNCELRREGVAGVFWCDYGFAEKHSDWRRGKEGITAREEAKGNFFFSKAPKCPIGKDPKSH